MFKQKILLLLLSIISLLQLDAQEIDYSSYDFASPLDIPLVLAANFGELRTNHFHTGLDFKTNRKTGYNIRSAEDGYISRIKVSPWGYGHAVYIDHYNGLTTVYAHIQSFDGKIADWVAKQQAKQENFAFNYYPTSDSLRVKKGQIIAHSGNTGGSTAPHLHFEIRDTKTEHALNPLLFNFDIEDTRQPTIRGLKLYSLTKEGYRVPDKSRRFRVYGNQGNYSISNNQVIVPASYTSKTGGIGFSFDAIDKLNAANNVCGIFEAFFIVDGDTIFSQNMEHIYFSSNRQINTHKDYEEYHNRRRHFHKAFKTIHNPLPIYRTMKNRGIINTQSGETYNAEYITKDAYGNTSKLKFDIIITEGKEKITQKLFAGKKILYPDSAFLSYDNSHYILFPPGLLYEPTPLILHASKNKITFGNDRVPLQETYKLMLPVSSFEDTKHVYIQRKDHRNRTTPEGGTVKDGWISTRVKSFGEFSVETDTIPPSIRRRNFKDNGTVSGQRLSWYIDEDKSGLIDYDIFINGKWHLLEYEPKRSLFFFDPPEALKGEKSVEIRAVDTVGNSSEETYSLTF